MITFEFVKRFANILNSIRNRNDNGMMTIGFMKPILDIAFNPINNKMKSCWIRESVNGYCVQSD
jgi:hypothetical protein